MEPLERRRLLSFTPQGPEVILTPAVGVLFDADVAIAANGSSMVASLYTDARTDTARFVVVRFSPAGQQVGEPLTVFSRPAPSPGSGGSVSVSVDVDGDAVVACLVSVGAATDTLHIVRASSSGVVSNSTLVAEADEMNSASVSMDAGGGFFVGWIELDLTNPSPGGGSVHVRAFDANGNPRAPQFVAVPQGPNSFPEQIDIAAQPDGTSAVLAYRDLPGNLVFLRAGRVSTTAPTSDFARIGESGMQMPSVAVQADGSFAVAYFFTDIEFRQSQGFLRLFDAAGNPRSKRIDVGGALGGDVHAVEVDDLTDGGYVVGFQHVDATTAPFSTETLYARRYSAAGTPDDAATVALVPHALNDATFGATGISADGNGHIVVAANEVFANTVHFRRLRSGPDAEGVFNEGRVVHVFGTPGADSIHVKREGRQIVASRGTTRRRFTAAETSALFLDGSGGNDYMTNDTPRNSTMLGGNGNDTLFGGQEGDTLRGGRGDDQLHGGDGDNTIRGDEDHDSIRAGAGVDLIYGDNGSDTIKAGFGDDHISAGDGKDHVFGQQGSDRIDGGSNDDAIDGGPGNDVIRGQGGSDKIFGGSGADRLDAGRDDDFIAAADDVSDTLFAGGGRDSGQVDAALDLLDGLETIT